MASTATAHPPAPRRGRPCAGTARITLTAACAIAPAAALASLAGPPDAAVLPQAEATSMLPLAHPSVLSLSEYPPVGHPARLEFAVTYGNGSSGSGSSNGGGGGSHAHAYPHAHGRAEHPYVRLDVTGSGSDMYSVYNITSNVGTTAPDVFEPYDHANTTIRAEPGRTYLVRADIVLDREPRRGTGARSAASCSTRPATCGFPTCTTCGRSVKRRAAAPSGRCSGGPRAASTRARSGWDRRRSTCA